MMPMSLIVWNAVGTAFFLVVLDLLGLTGRDDLDCLHGKCRKQDPK